MAGASTAAVLVFAVSLLKVMVGGEAAGPAGPCDPAGGLNGFPFCDVSLSIDARAADLVGRLTLPEKVQQLVNQAGAVPRLGIPAYQWWSEALHGVSNVGPGSRFGGSVPGATQFPQVIHSAASFNTSLWFLLGQAVSTEARGMYNVGSAGLTFWSPNVNVFRDPRWGRGQETPGEDPTLTSKYAVNYVRGLQTAPDGGDSLKVAACCKHYTAYDLDNWNGIQRYTFDARVTAQDLADTFDPPFQSCVEDAGVASVMCSYNKVNGVPSCADPNLLAGTVRGNWKLNGYIVSDCDSVDVFFRSQRYTATAEAAAAAALNAGLDLNCGSFLAQHTEAAVRMGLVNESRVDDAVLNNVRVLMRLGWFDGAKKLFGNLGAADVCSDEHRQLALEAARQGIVLLKNDDGALPLSPAKIATLAVVGPNANVTNTMIGNYAGVACRYTTPLQGLSSYTKTVYAPGCANVLCADGGLVSGAATAAAGADAVVVLVGGDQTLEAESRDRSSLRLPGKQEDLVNAVIQAARGPVILFIMSGGPFDIDFAKGSDKVAGILWAGYPGQEGGQAIGDAIFGAYSPCGRLPVSWYPEEYTKIPMTNMNMRPDPATGYPGRTHRFYTGRTLYQFGDGLSYTAFNHTLVRAPSLVSLALHGSANRHGQGGACAGSGNGTCRAVRVTHTRCSGLSMDVHVDVHNLGKRDSGHVLLLFSSPPSRGRGRGGAPRRHLIGFQRLHVSAGATHRVHFAVDVCRDLSVVDTRGARRLPVGSHILHVGRVKHSFNMQLGN